MHNRYIERRRQGWYVVLAVPPKLWGVIGKKKEVKSLKTRDVEEARRRRWGAIAEIQRKFREAEGGQGWVPAALEFRERIQKANPEGEEWSERDEYESQALEKAQFEVAPKYGDLAGGRFADLVRGRYFPLSALVERWLAEIKGTVTGQTSNQRDFALRWLKQELGEDFNARTLTREKAGDLLDKLKAGKRSPRTVNRIVSDIRQCWEWGKTRGYVEGENPWEGQRDPRGKRAKKVKRPYTKDELLALLRADARAIVGERYGAAINEIMRVDLMTGARLDELAGLEVDEVSPGERAIRIGDGKTKNAIRWMPLHPSVWPIIERRLKAAKEKGSAVLYPELPPAGPDKKRGWKMSNAFTQFRREVLGMPPEDRSADFHSVRRCFSTYLENATRHTIKVNVGGEERLVFAVTSSAYAELMGHTKGMMAKDLYSGGLVPQYLRDAIEQGLAVEMEPEVLKAIEQLPSGPAPQRARRRRSPGEPKTN